MYLPWLPPAPGGAAEIPEVCTRVGPTVFAKTWLPLAAIATKTARSSTDFEVDVIAVSPRGSLFVRRCGSMRRSLFSSAPNLLMPVPLPASGFVLAEQDHRSVGGPVWIADADGIDGLDRTRLARWPAHRRWRMRIAQSTTYSCAGRWGVWPAYGLRVIARIPILVALRSTLPILFTPPDIVIVTKFYAFVMPICTYRVTFPYRPCLGESAKRHKKRKRQRRQ